MPSMGLLVEWTWHIKLCIQRDGMFFKYIFIYYIFTNWKSNTHMQI